MEEFYTDRGSCRICCVWTFVGMVIYREVSFRDLFDILVDSAKTTGGIMLIVASASLFSFVCTKFGIADAASGLLASIAHNQFVFLLIVNIIFLIAGCFIDANSAMYIFIPIMLPVCKALGYDVVAFGVMATVNLAIGQVTPPVGVNLLLLSVSGSRKVWKLPAGDLKGSYADDRSQCGGAS